jgi:hypothetical protein
VTPSKPPAPKGALVVSSSSEDEDWKASTKEDDSSSSSSSSTLINEAMTRRLRHRDIPSAADMRLSISRMQDKRTATFIDKILPRVIQSMSDSGFTAVVFFTTSPRKANLKSVSMTRRLRELYGARGYDFLLYSPRTLPAEKSATTFGLAIRWDGSDFVLPEASNDNVIKDGYDGFRERISSKLENQQWVTFEQAFTKFSRPGDNDYDDNGDESE